MLPVDNNHHVADKDMCDEDLVSVGQFIADCFDH
jgi:hypothetical protein